jgi:hypothetical protein
MRGRTLVVAALAAALAGFGCGSITPLAASDDAAAARPRPDAGTPAAGPAAGHGPDDGDGKGNADGKGKGDDGK